MRLMFIDNDGAATAFDETLDVFERIEIVQDAGETSVLAVDTTGVTVAFSSDQIRMLQVVLVDGED